MKLKKIGGKILSVLLSISCISAAVPVETEYSSAQTAVETVHNIVLFAQFENTESYNFMADRADEIEAMCNDTETVRSLAGYINTVSYGQMNTVCHFPQLEDGVITPYQFSQEESTYLNAELAAIEAVENIAVPEGTPLDGNNDGTVDNIILIVDASAEGADSLFWPCAMGLNGLEINGKTTGTLNLHNSISVFENYISGGAGVLCHEFMHSIGYPDLYRSGRTGIPVGQWDIMASNSVFVQYPIAYMRSRVSGWLEPQTITSNGRYTLSPASSDSGNRLYILKTPLSDTEFFAVEYRQQGAAYSEEMDVKIYGSGLVVYRVNTEVSGNYKSDKDEIYVFRPGETSLDAGEGDIFSSNYGGEGRLTEIGSLDFQDGITEGALVYSDGTNSGIRLSEITLSDDTLSFTAEFASLDNMELWRTAADASSLSGAVMLDMDSSENDQVYILSSHNSYGMLCKLSDGDLMEVGRISDSFYNGRLVFAGNVPYVLYNNADYNYVLKRYVNNKWETVYQSTSLSQYTDISACNGKIYIAYTEGSFPYELSAACYDTETGILSKSGGVIAENACSLSVQACEDSLFVSYRDLNDNSKPKIARWDGSEWNVTTLSEQPSEMIDSAVCGDSIYAAVTGESEGAYLLSGDEITCLPFSEIPGDCFSALPITVNESIYIAINTQNEDDFSLYSYNDNLVKTGNSIAAELVNSPDVLYSDGTIYAAYISQNGTAVIKSYCTETVVTVIGDVNTDGVFDMDDITALQMFLVDSGDLPDRKAGDLNSDNKLDIFDLCLMKGLIID